MRESETLELMEKMQLEYEQLRTNLEQLAQARREYTELTDESNRLKREIEAIYEERALDLSRKRTDSLGKIESLTEKSREEALSFSSSYPNSSLPEGISVIKKNGYLYDEEEGRRKAIEMKMTEALVIDRSYSEYSYSRIIDLALAAGLDECIALDKGKFDKLAKTGVFKFVKHYVDAQTRIATNLNTAYPEQKPNLVELPPEEDSVF